jgi:dipeptidyl aminopeptidase/acylaminoacyl peptidase
MRRFLTLCAIFAAAGTWYVHAQQPASKGPAANPSAAAAPFTLSIDGIMSGPKLVGTPPTAVRFLPDSSKIVFSWQKPGEDRPATYVVNRDGTDLKRLTPEEARQLPATPTGRLDVTRQWLLTIEGGDVVVYNMATHARRPLMRTAAVEANPRWARAGAAVTFVRDGNLFLMTLGPSAGGPSEVQLTDSSAAGSASAAAGGARGGGQVQGARGGGNQGEITASQRVLREEEMALIEHLRREAEQRQRGGGGGRGGRGGFGATGGAPAQPIARFVPGPRQSVTDMRLSGDEHYAYITVVERPEVPARNQDVPNYVTESAYPEMINGRSDVGDSQPRRLLAILDLKADKTQWADASSFAGNEKPSKPGDEAKPRIVEWSLPECSDDGNRCLATVRSADFHDRWLVTIDPATGKATSLDDLHDDAWIREEAVSTATGAGVGMGYGIFGGGAITWLPDNKRVIYLAERDGWLHLYTLDVTADRPSPKALTSGKWEVTSARLSNDGTKVYFTSNEVHPGERQFYTVSVDGGPITRITATAGGHEVTVSPDEKTLVDLYSTINRPPEIYVMPFAPGAKETAVTTTPTAQFLAFKWIEPKIVTYKARDGQMVYARLYTPEMIGAKRDPRHPAVLFIHGAGYLQFALKYWSDTYYREHMFNHLLASKGYVVLAPDYRASSGYGRDWRTGIYRHMGGKDLDDVVDGAKFLVAAEKVNPNRIGIYGGSYGGFMTLMAMFTTPDVFAAGAALRPVTDWAHYNNAYTAPILGLPQTDLEAYKRSSPISFAEGLKGQLLICHGIVDTNVFYQDTVRLMQRLIELRKETWSVAPYPVENHSFTEETSWADEYKRIYKLFEEYLRK